VDRQSGALRQNAAEVALAEEKTWYLISYDVRDEKRLRRVAKHLEGYGERIQMSIFRCRLKRRSLERLNWELVKMMDKEDDLLIIRLCPACTQRIIRKGSEETWSQEVVTYEIV
jgi:CRISPR-associated protein Cas2